MKKLLLTLSSLIIALSLCAERYPWNVECLGGLAISRPTALGYTAGVGLNYYFTPWLGIGTGTRFSSYHTQTLLQQPWTYSGTDYQGHAYTQITTPIDIGEQQKLGVVEIPLLMRFRYQPDQQLVGFTASLGALMGIPVSIKYASISQDGRLRNERYYPTFDVTLHNIPTIIEDEQIAPYEFTDSPSATLNWAAHCAIGVLFRVHQHIDLSLSAYCNYYITPSPSSSACCYSSSSRPWQAGLMLALSINAGRNRTASPISPLPDTLPPTTYNLQPTTSLPDTLQPTPYNLQPISPLPDSPTPQLTQSSCIVHCQPSTITPSPPLLKGQASVTIFFPLNGVEPILQPKTVLTDVANDLIANPSMRVYITGHTCNLGSVLYNASLSLQRARSVADLLHALGVPRKQMIIRSVGATQPFSTDGPHALEKDRRVEITPISAYK